MIMSHTLILQNIKKKKKKNGSAESCLGAIDSIPPHPQQQQLCCETPHLCWRRLQRVILKQ